MSYQLSLGRKQWGFWLCPRLPFILTVWSKLRVNKVIISDLKLSIFFIFLQFIAFRAVLILVLKSNWFCMIGLKNSHHFFHPIRSKTKINREALVFVFLHFVSETCNYIKFLIGSMDCLCSLWLAREIIGFSFTTLHWKPPWCLTHVNLINYIEGWPETTSVRTEWKK